LKYFVNRFLILFISRTVLSSVVVSLNDKALGLGADMTRSIFVRTFSAINSY